MLERAEGVGDGHEEGLGLVAKQAKTKEIKMMITASTVVAITAGAGAGQGLDIGD
jgi:cell division GTPase FtsZ